MIRPREWDYNKSGALKRRTSLGAEKRGIMTTGRYNSSEGSHIGTAITFLLIGLGAGALAGLLLAPKAGKQLRKDLRRGASVPPHRTLDQGFESRVAQLIRPTSE